MSIDNLNIFTGLTVYYMMQQQPSDSEMVPNKQEQEYELQIYYMIIKPIVR